MRRGILPGLIILVIGILFLLRNFGLFDFAELRRFWPLLLVAFGLSRLWDRVHRARWLGAVLVAAGVALQLSNLGLLHVSLRGLLRFWPLAIVAFGLQLLFERGRKGNLLGGISMIAFGAALQADALGWMHLALARLWPVVLIVVGIVMLQKALRGGVRAH